MHRISLPLIVMILVALAVPAFGDAARDFESLFGEQVKKVRATPGTDDDLATARTIMEMAGELKDETDLMVIMYKTACDLASNAPEGRKIVFAATEKLNAIAPKDAHKWQEYRVNFYRTLYTRARGKDRRTAGEAYIEALVDAGDRLTAAGEGKEAGTMYRQALPVASAVGSERKAEIAEKIRNLAAVIQKNRAFDDLREKLEKNPKDVKARESLIDLYLLENDDSVKASQLATADIDESIRRMLPLAAKAVRTVAEDDSLKLAEWYNAMAKEQSSPLRKGVAYRRAYDYYSVFQARHKKGDIKGLKAKIEQGNIAKRFKMIKVPLPERKTLKAEGPEVEIPADIPELVSGAVRPFDWKKEKQKLQYTYSEMVFSKGGFDYSDHNRTKLLDGLIKTRWSAHSVGWSKMNPPMIVFKFATVVQPKAIKIRLFGKDTGGNVAMTKGIRVYTGTGTARGRVVGEVLNIVDHTAWVTVPLKTSPSQYFWIELARSTQMFVMLDEVEFE